MVAPVVGYAKAHLSELFTVQRPSKQVKNFSDFGPSPARGAGHRLVCGYAVFRGSSSCGFLRAGHQTGMPWGSSWRWRVISSTTRHKGSPAVAAIESSVAFTSWSISAYRGRRVSGSREPRARRALGGVLLMVAIRPYPYRPVQGLPGCVAGVLVRSLLCRQAAVPLQADGAGDVTEPERGAGGDDVRLAGRGRAESAREAAIVLPKRQCTRGCTEWSSSPAPAKA